MQRILAILVILMVSSSGYADLGNPFPIRNTAVDSALRNYVPKEVRDLANGKRSRTPKRAVDHAPLSVSDFRPGKGRPTIEAFFANAKLDFIAMKDLRPIVERTFVVVEGKLRKNNVASALGFVIASSMLIARNTNLDDDGLNELVATINDRLANEASFRSMSATDRQTMYDSLMLLGAVLVTMHAYGEHDEGIKADAMEIADALLRANGE
jgi:hypothetical protein